MAVTSSLSKQGDTLTIAVEGPFDFHVAERFKQCYEDPAVQHVKTYAVDLAKTNQIDSSALGLLLVLRDYVEKENAAVVITNCLPHVKKLLEMSNFHKLFTIS